ncbi:hypothetical protein BT96DRAFT_993874 [Gymnopus androsaceus JB14]|uniref:Protein kinase domain-containing protein n=1 Tax=Gymnopus androsaceus JB14 TaxID=1447944 RepID=A0A6A4HKX7_9AGAR|nr:hypothetical protein BT96DRAFT_993874 [Gymnopus androsaceus JB14]
MADIYRPDTPRICIQSLTDLIPGFRERNSQNLAPSIPEISFDCFKKLVLPDVSDDKLKNAVQTLHEKRHLNDNGWVRLLEESDAQAQEGREVKEAEYFAPLFEALNSILGEDSTVFFSNNPAKSLWSEGDNSSYIADVNVLLRKSTSVSPRKQGEEFECDVVATGDLEMDSTPDKVNDNNVKVVSNATHIMGADPIRRFMFGLTIDSTNVRLWFFSRSHVFVAKIFDLHLNVRHLIYVALSIGYASKDELGFDPSVERILAPDKRPVYIFKVGDKEYMTKEAIAVRKAKSLLGRAPRIFKVLEVINREPLQLGPITQFLKDYWIPEDSPTELETRNSIRDNVNKVNRLEWLDVNKFDDYFVKIDACVKILVKSLTDPDAEAEDSSSNFLRNGSLPSKCDRYRLVTSMTTYLCPPTVSIDGSLMTGSETEAERRISLAQYESVAAQLANLDWATYGSKVHCRVISEDAGEPFDQKLSDWPTILNGLQLLLTGLAFMHSAGFVHRDISNGNVLCRDSMVKLNDLEYSKRIQPEPLHSSESSDAKTGTPYFMPIEVKAARYMFMSRSRIFAPANHYAVPFTFHYNYVHDLESLLWIFVFALTSKLPETVAWQNPSAQDELFAMLFLDAVQRQGFFIGFDQSSVLAQISNVPQQLYPIWSYAEEFAEQIRQYHSKLQAQANPPIIMAETAFFPELYADLNKLLEKIKADAYEGKVIEPRFAKKRAQEEHRKEPCFG